VAASAKDAEDSGLSQLNAYEEFAIFGEDSD
jgi:hypothetical protein